MKVLINIADIIVDNSKSLDKFKEEWLKKYDYNKRYYFFINYRKLLFAVFAIIFLKIIVIFLKEI